MPHPRLAWRISPQLYAWRRRGAPAAGGLPPFLVEGVEHAEQAGYEGVEFSLSLLRPPDRVRAITALLRRHRVAFAAGFATVPAGAPTAALEALVRDAAAARDAGCSVMNVATVAPAAHPLRPEDTLIATARTLAALTALLGGYATRVCWHPHDEHLRGGGHGMVSVLEEAEALSKEAGAPSPAVCLDLGWVLRAGENVTDLLAAAGDRLGAVHVRDCLDGVWCQAVGEGELDLDGVASWLLRARYGGWLAVELWMERRTAVTRRLDENARVSRAALGAALRRAAGSGVR